MSQTFKSCAQKYGRLVPIDQSIEESGSLMLDITGYYFCLNQNKEITTPIMASCSRLEEGFQILYFVNILETHKWKLIAEYDVLNCAAIDTDPRKQNKVKINFTLNPGESTVLVFRQLYGRKFDITGGDPECEFTKVKF